MAKRQSYLSQPNILRLPNLLREVQAGEIRVPRFQRPFVWTIDQRLELFKSIYEGIPVGSFLIWRTREHNLQCYDHLGFVDISWPRRSDEEEVGSIRQYLLDGHQRLTTLYVSLGEGLMSEPILEAEAASVPTFSEKTQYDRDWPIFFDLEERAFQPTPRHGGPPVTWLPLAILLDPSKLYEFQKSLLEAGADRALVNRAESLASTFKDYSIPVVPIVTEDLELATQSFQRVNSGGTKMTEVHMVSALTWSPDFDLNERMKEILVDLGELGWQHLEEKMILNVCKAALDLDIYHADTEDIQKAIKSRPQVLQEATESLKVAARFLREQCKVYGPAVLPYSFQIVLLADALRRATGGLERDLNSTAAKAVERWFWLTTYTEHFAGISDVRLDRTLKHLRNVAAGIADPNPPGMSREVSPTPRRFDFRAARSRAITLRLAQLNPQSGYEFHDPFQLLADFGRDAMPMLIPSQKVEGRQAEGPENRILIHPREASAFRRSLKEYSFRRLVAELTQQPPDEAPYLESHAISEAAVGAYEAGDYEGFLLLRRETIVALERAFVESLGLELMGD